MADKPIESSGGWFVELLALMIEALWDGSSSGPGSSDSSKESEES
jgi:hypothetical protein